MGLAAINKKGTGDQGRILFIPGHRPLLRWALQDSNLRPTGYASHFGFRRPRWLCCPWRVCGLDYLFTLTHGVPAV